MCQPDAIMQEKRFCQHNWVVWIIGHLKGAISLKITVVGSFFLAECNNNRKINRRRERSTQTLCEGNNFAEIEISRIFHFKLFCSVSDFGSRIPSTVIFAEKQERKHILRIPSNCFHIIIKKVG